MAGPAGPGGQRHGRQQRGLFGGEPAQRLLGGGGRADDGPWQRRVLGLRGEERVEQRGGGARGVQPVVEQPAQRGAPGPVVVAVPRLFGGVGPEQVVEGVAAATVLAEQVPAGQLGQHGARPGPAAIPARLAAAAAVMSGPGCKPSSRNIRAVSGLSAR